MRNTILLGRVRNGELIVYAFWFQVAPELLRQLLSSIVAPRCPNPLPTVIDYSGFELLKFVWNLLICFWESREHSTLRSHQ